jgi:adenosylcobinamide-phosphate synthase
VSIGWLDVSTRLWVLAGALLIDVGIGYPDWLFARIGHPVTWAGALIDGLDRRLNRPERAQDNRGRGILAVSLVLTISIAPAMVVQSALAGFWAGLVCLAVLASSLSAMRSLDSHVGAVADALDLGGLAAGRRCVARIVGRDPEALDAAGISRAAIESLAENFSDGVVAPALWFAVAGLPGMLAYKAINTADSMIGHRTPRHQTFGWAAARLDDLVNLPASRLSALLLLLAAGLMPGASPWGAIRAVVRDASKHRSPNAGWPEAAVAGALGLKLAGARAYHGVMIDDGGMGDGRAEATSGDIRRAVWLARIAGAIGWLAIAVTASALVR